MRIIRLLPLLLLSGSAFADGDLHGRFLREVGSSTDTKLASFSKRGSYLEGLGRPVLEYSLGLLYSDNVDRGFFSIGPVWQHISYTGYGIFAKELSFAPTLLSSGKLENRDMGGIVHFTTGLNVGWKPSVTSSLYVGLRLQHISNGSIHRRNPGMDSFGLELTWTPQF